MKTIELLWGTGIETAAHKLVRNAPACADFNGVRLRARHATTRPRDIVAHYHRQSEERSIIWRNSPDGKLVAAETAAAAVWCQAVIDRQMGALAGLYFDDVPAVIAWVEPMIEATDRVGVVFNRAAVGTIFAHNGWGTNVNCGEAFDESDARNVAGWIVGQWLACGWPGIDRFIDDWRAKFSAVAA